MKVSSAITSILVWEGGPCAFVQPPRMLTILLLVDTIHHDPPIERGLW